MPNRKTQQNIYGEDIAIIKSDVEFIKEALKGNQNDKGLIAEVKENTDFRITQTAKTNMIRYFAGAGWGIVLVSTVLIILLG